MNGGQLQSNGAVHLFGSIENSHILFRRGKPDTNELLENMMHNCAFGGSGSDPYAAKDRMPSIQR